MRSSSLESGFIKMTPRPGPASSGTSSTAKRTILPRAVATIADRAAHDVDADDLVAVADARELPAGAGGLGEIGRGAEAVAAGGRDQHRAAPLR